MNKIYAVVWNRTRCMWTVVSEIASRVGRPRAVASGGKRCLRGFVSGATPLIAALWLPSWLAHAQTIVGPSTTPVTLNGSDSYQVDNGTTISSTGQYVNSLTIAGIAPFTFTNLGTIKGSNDGGGSAIYSSINGTIINQATGSIWGATWGLHFSGSVANGNVINYGDISARVSHPVDWDSSASGTFDNYGTVNLGTAGTVDSTANGVTLQSSGLVTINNHSGASIKSGVNNATWGDAFAIYGSGGVHINNEGLIQGYHSVINNEGSSVIELYNKATGQLSSTLEYALLIQSNSTIRNAGSISSPVGAINFLGSNNTLVIENTSSITGTVLGGTNGTLALGGSTAGSFDMSQLGASAQYRNFSTFDKVDTGTWTLTGTSNANWKVSNGTLILADAASLSAASSLTVMPGGTFQFGQGGTGSLFGGSFINNGSLVFNQSGGPLVSTVVSGTGNVVLRDKAQLTYGANNTYTGTTTIDSGAILRVGEGGSSGAVVGGIVDNGQLIFNRSDATVYAGDVSGSGSFSHVGTGALTLTGTNTHTGGTTVATGGTLQVGAGGSIGSVAGNIVNNGTLIADRSGSLEFDGVISGTGTLIKRGSGVLQLSGENTYGGATRLEAGVLAATSAGNFGTLGSSLIFDGGTLRWLNSFFIGRPAELLAGGGTLDSNALNVEWRSLTTGVGRLSKTGQGTVSLTADNTYSGGTSVLGGNLQLGNGGTAGSVLGNIANDASLTFNRSDDVSFTGVISGTGSMTQSGPGTLTLTANQTYTGGTTISGGRLQLGSGGTTGAVAGNVLNNGQLIVNRSDNITDAVGLVSGSGGFTKLGTGTLTLTRNQLYTGATTISEGTLRIGNGGTSGGIRGNIINNAILIHDRSDAVTFSSSLSGSGTFLKSGSGTLRMTASNPFTGSSQLNAGLTLVDGSLDGSVQVNNGATLGGVGTLGGTVTIANGGHLAPGDSPGTVTIDSLVLNSTSQLDYELGLPNVVGGGVNDLTEVSGNLTLDGVLNITDVGGFGDGVYRLFNYGGSLTDNGLLFGGLPLGFANSDLLLQTAVVNQVNLIVSQGGLSVQFWDGPNVVGNGTIDGGTSTWNSLSSHWTNSVGDVNAPWQNGFAVFQGAAGTVTLGENIATTGLQFLTTGYVVNGGPFNLHSDANNLPIRVDAGVTATINAAIHDGSAGATRLIKRDAGTLVLGGPNAYTGGTVVEGGTLQVGSDTNLGESSGGVELDNAGLATRISLTTNRALVLGSGLGVLTPAAGTTLVWNGAITGEGGLDKQGTATLVLGADNTYTGNTRLTGTLQLGNGGSNGSVLGNIVNNGVLVVNRNNALTLDGIISGTGALTQQGTGTTTLTGLNTYAGGTSLNGGVLVASTDTRLGAAAGGLSFDGGTLRTGAGFDSSRAVSLAVGGGSLDDASGATFRGVFSGVGGLTKLGAGVTVLTADNSYTGGTSIAAGTLRVGDGGTSGSLLGNISNNGALIFDRADASSFTGIISGSGEVSVIGGGTLTLGGVNTYSHVNGTQVREGSTLIVGSDANLGAASNRVLLRNGSTLRLTSSFDLVRAFVLEGVGNYNHIDTLANTTTITGVISGESGLQKDGSGSLILTGANSYIGGTTIAAGTLQIGNGGAGGSLLGNISNNGALVFNRSGSLTFDGLVSGTGTLTQAGPGTLVLTGNHSYSGGTSISAGTLQLGAGGTSGSVAGNISNNGALVFNRGDSLSYAGIISGTGTLNKQGAGALTLSGANTYTGATTVSAGRLLVTGSLAGLVQVNSGATLGGTGNIGGAVTVANGGTLAPGTSPGTLSMASLVLNPDSILEYELGLPNVVGGGVNDLVSVAGNLTLDGHLNVVNVGAFGNGVYRLFDYGGTLTNNGLLFGSLPSGFSAADLVVQTSIANQVNLLVSAGGFGLQFWDGANLTPNGVIDGGSGVWETSAPRWTNGAGDANTQWLGNFAVFQGAAGTVTLGQDIGFTGAQFRTDGYVLEGGSFSLQGNAADTVLRVDAGVSATLNAALRDGTAGAVRLLKTDAGTLIIGTANSHTGGTAIEGGRLQVGADAALGASGSALSINAGALATTSSFGNTRAVVLGADGGVIAPAAGTTLGLAGVISGPGMLDKQDAGTLVFSGDVNTYAGGTRLSGGVLAVSLLGHLGNSGSGLTFAGGTLRLDASFNLAATRLITLEAGGGTIDTNGNTSVLSQAMHGSGAFTKAGAGTLTLVDNQLYTGLTTVAAGTLQIGTGGTTGSLLGAVVDNGTLVFARSDVLGYDQVISGSGNVIQQGPGRLVWTADHTYTGGTLIAGGTLQLGSNSATGSVLGNIVDNGALIFARNNAVSFAGTISGSGSLTQQGPGALTFTANHSYTGGTTINSGASLALGTGGTAGMVVGDITNNGSLSVNRSDNVSLSGAIAGSGSLIKLGAGELQLLGNVSQTSTTVSAGSLRVGDGGTAGSISGDIVNNGALIFQRTDSYTQGSTVSGSGSLEQRGAGTLILPRANTYTGGTLISAGTLQIGDGLGGSVVGNITNNGVLNFNRDGNLSYAGIISGSGTLNQIGAGTLTLSGANTLTGLTSVNAGQLHVDGSLAGAVQVNSGATLGGVGSVGGLVTVAGGGILAPGNSAGTLTFDSLLLNDSSQLAFELGVPNIVGGTANDLISVGGNLTLDGNLNLVNLGGFSDGVYRLFNYGGTLTNNGLQFGSLPSGVVAGDLLLQTNVANQINLIVSQGGLALQFWDGANTTGNGVINGGTGSWNNAASNWTNSTGAVNAPWQGGFAVFQGTGGSVSVTQDVSATGMQFLSNGYLVHSGAFTVTSTGPEFVLRANAGITAEISLVLTGTSKLIKRDAGTLVLSHTNTYTGGTRIEGGTLRITTGDASLGAAGTVLEMDGGTLASPSNLTISRPVSLEGSGGTVSSPTGGVFTVSGVISGPGSLTKIDGGTLALTADNTYTGGTTISGGFLRIGGGGTTGSVLGDIVNNGTLVINRSNQLIIDGSISGTGAFIQRGTGVTQLNASNSYSGGTTLEAGVLDAAQDNRLGAASGALHFDGGTLHTGAGFDSSRLITITSNGGTLEDANGATLRGVISGSGGLTKTGAGITVLSADNTYTGGTTVSAGTLQIGAAGTSGSILGDVVNNGVLLFNRSDATTFAGDISGTGEVSVFGRGTLTLTGANTYSSVNGTQVRGGSTLVVANNGNLGAATTRVLLRNSTLRLDGSFALTRNLVLEGAGGTNTLDTQANTVTVTGVISGETALDKQGSGTLILTNDNTYIDGTTIAAGTLQVGNGGTSGFIQGNVSNSGALVFNRSDGIAYDGVVSGSGSLTQAGSGTLFLLNDHTHTGGTGITAGTLQIGDGGNAGSVAGNISNNSALVFNRNDSYSHAGVISGSGTLRQAGSGRLILGGANTYSGLTTVANGSLLLTGSLAGGVQVNSGTTFGGNGTVAGAVNVASGGILAPGTSPGTLTLGSLVLNASSELDYELGLPDIVGGTVNDLTVVNGNLTLDGNLNIRDAGGFGYGVYRLFNYSGTLTNNGLNFRLLPGVFTPGELLLQTSIASQINLIVTQGGFDLQFWDGPNLVGNNAIDGGTSNWNAVDSHWTGSDGAVNAPWQSGFAVFQGTAGTVSLAQNANFSGAQFRTDGYVVTGTFALAGANDTVLRVDPNVTATVAVKLVDGGAPMHLLKTDLGTLVLTGVNTYSGGTTIRDGSVRINADTALGAAGGGVTLEGAILAGSGNINSSRAFTLSGEGGDFEPAAGTSMSLAGVVGGEGSLVKADAGTLVLSGINTYLGGTRITEGVLGIRADNNLGASSGSLELAGGTLRLDASFTLPATRNLLIEAIGGRIDTQANNVTVATAIQGDGALTKQGSGRLVLTGLNGYLGGTTIAAGSLQVGAGGTTGRVLGNIIDNGTLIFARSDVAGYDGIISGSGNLVQQGPGRLVLTGDHTYSGGTTVSGGILQLGSTTTTGSVLGNILNNAGLIFARSDDTTYAGVVSGTGTLTQQGPGKLTLTGNNNYSGGTSVLTGVSLQVGAGGNSGALTGNIANNGRVIFNRADNVSYAGNITGTGAFTQQGPGMLTLLGSLNESGQTTVAAGSLKIGNGGAVGSLSGDVLNNAALIFHRSDNISYGGVVSGSGSLEQRGPGTLVLTGNQTYTGGTLISAGTLQVGAGTSGRLSGDVVNQGHLLFARNDSVAYNGVVSGSGRLTQNGSGTLVLTATHTYTGVTTVAGGTLQLDGSVAGDAQVNNGASLTGVGSVAGLLTVANGGHLAPGDSPGTLHVGGLLLNSGSILDYELGLPDVIGGDTNDLIEVAGNLTLDGTVNVSNVGGFGDGVYRLINYGGALTNNGLLLGTLPTGIVGSEVAVQTSIDQQVNLVVSRGGFALQFWDGADTSSDGVIDGGSAVWNNSQSHWTNVDGNANLSWQSGFAVFSVSPGTVTLGEDVNISGMQFSTAGYHVTGDGHQIGLDAAESVVRVYNRGEATVDAVLADGVNGAAKLILRDRGTLILNGANTYSGGTLIEGGVLQIASNANLGAAATAVELNAGTLISTGSFSTDRGLVLGKSHGALSPAANTTLTWSGQLSGPGGLNKLGAGTLILTGDNRYAVGTFLGAGVLEVSRDANLGTAAGGLMLGGGTLRWGADFGVGAARNIVLTAAGRFDTNGHTGSLNHVISGDGGLIKQGQGTLVLSADNVYAGNTQIDAGTLQIGNGGTTGNVLGSIQNNGTLAFARSNDVTFAGTVVGAGALVQRGAGTLTLSANQGYTGGTTIASGKLMLGQGGATGSVLGNISNAGELIVNRSDNLLYEGVVSGSGAVTKQQNNTLVLSADQTYTGLTTIQAGQLRLGNGGATGSLAGNVLANGELAFFRSNAVSFAGTVSGTGSLRQLGSGVLTLSGSNSYSGGTFLDSGTVSVGNDSALGAVSGGVSFDGGTLRLTASFDSDRSFHLAQGNGAIETVGSRNKLSQNIDGNGMLIKTGDGVLILNYGGSHTGGTQVRAGSLVVGDSAHPQAVLRNGAVGVAAGAALGGYGSIIGNVTNEGFIGVGNALPALASEPDAVFTVAGNLANRGTVSLLNGVAADRLVVKQGSFYTFGGLVQLETFLNGGDLNTQSDQLVVDGVRRGEGGGMTGLQINAVGGAGQVTDGDGIRVVDVTPDGVSEAGAFALVNRVVAGSHEYLLFHGGLSDPNDGDWYLRSESSEPAAPLPILRPEIGGFVGNRFMAERMLVHTLHQRQGEPDPTLDSDDQERGPLWANVNGVEANTQTHDGLVQLRSNSWRLQTGVDLLRHRSGGGSVLRAGAFLQYGQADTDTQAVINPARGNAQVTGYGLGLYATWFGNPDTLLGAYVDGWLQYNRFDNEVDGSAGYHADYDAKGWAASLEAGYAIALGKRIVLEPQLQYVRVNLDTDGLLDSSHTQIVDLTRSDWAARIGARLYGVPDKPGGFSPFVEVNWWRRAGNAAMQFNTDQVDHLVPKSLPTLDVGVQGNFGHGWNTWLRLGTDLSDERDQEISGSAGVRFQW